MLPTKVQPSAKIIETALKKPLPPEKLTEALEKVRKGATSSFTFTKTLSIVHALGWKLESMSAWVPLHYPSVYSGKTSLMLQSANAREPKDRPALIELHKKMLGEASIQLPTKVTVGKRVFMDVSPIKEGNYEYHYFEWKEWVGADGIKLTTPRNEIFELIHDHHSVGKPLEHGMYRFHHFFTKGGWKEDASAALGKEIHIPAAARTRENTGTCPVCWRNHKLSNGVLVLHGYKRPGWGQIRGNCDAVRYQPLETSVEGASMWFGKIVIALKKEKTKLTDIESGNVTELLHPRTKQWLKPGDPFFKMLFDNFERDTRSNIKLYENDIVLYEKIIAAWKPRPLPQQGEMERGTKFFLKP